MARLIMVEVSYFYELKKKYHQNIKSHQAHNKFLILRYLLKINLLMY